MENFAEWHMWQPETKGFITLPEIPFYIQDCFISFLIECKIIQNLLIFKQFFG